MIKLVVIDKELNTQNRSVHTVKSEGVLQSISCDPVQTDVLDKIDDDNKLVVIVNINLKGENSSEILEQIKYNKTKICLLISHEDKVSMLNDSVMTDAHWILFNDKSDNSFIKEIKQVINDGKQINGRITKRILNFISKPQGQPTRKKSAPLTEREIEILRMISTGATNKVLAKELGITIHTVKNHLKRIFSKFEVNNRSEAINAFLKYDKV